MAFSVSLSQTSLAAAMLASGIGSYMGLSPPNISTKPTPSTGDMMRWLCLTDKRTVKVILAPLGFLTLHTASLALYYPKIPPFILRHGATNSLNPNLITWSAATSIPLALILCVGVPLRLISYGSLGKNFTFTLAEPDHLTTTGIYRSIQHPSYTGFMILITCNLTLLIRIDGVLGCWALPTWYESLRTLEWTLLVPLTLTLSAALWMRVRQEERMLRARFGVEWERWHARTSRFIPWIF